MFTHEDEKYFLKAMKDIKHPHDGLPLLVFESLCKIIPFVGCEIVIKNQQNQLLLTWRDDKWYHGWHFPGGLLRAGDTFEYRINQTSIRELGVKIKKIKFVEPLNNGRKDHRGYGISLVFLCSPVGTPKKGKFFSKMPKDIIPEHKNLWKEVIKTTNMK